MAMESSDRRADTKADSGDDSDAPFPELLDFCSRAQTLISQLLLLSDRLPSEFRDRRFDPVLFDLTYFDSPDEFESRIEGNTELEALEDQLRESCADYLKWFFVFVNSVVVYYLELLKYLNDLHEGVSVQFTLDRVLENESGLPLLAESITLFGCLLLLMEHLISGFLREKLLVAHIRHDRCFNSLNLDHVFLLCRVHLPASVSHHVSSLPSSFPMVSIQKPEDLFARFPFPKLMVNAIVSRVREGDMYREAHHYPDPQHRTVALSLQSGCLYVLLFYSPELLHNGFVMREIVDRFFKDSWVVPIFLYFSVDLFASWDSYKEAKASLSTCFSLTSVRDRAQLHSTKVIDILSELDLTLSNGVLTQGFVLDNSQHLLSLVRNCNVTLRWLLLHRISFDKKLRDIVTSAGLAHQVNGDTLLLLLLKSSKFELEVKQLFAELLGGRQALWHEKKSAVSDCIQKLLGLCTGSWVSSCKIKNESLKDLLGRLSFEIHSLDYTRTGGSGRLIHRLISALKDVEQLQSEESHQIRQHVSEAQKHLQDMFKLLNLDNGMMSTFSKISDAVYAWGYITEFSTLMSKKVQQDPSVLLNLHAFFLKFRMLLNAPLLRVKQNQSPDLCCVSQYYSSNYAAQICATLEIVPVMLLRIFCEDSLQTEQLFHLQSHIDCDNINDFKQLDQQLRLSKAANKISILSKGMLVMSRNFLGLINLDLKEWLVGQIQKELSKLLDSKLNSFLSFSSAEPEKIEAALRMLSSYILSQSRMMESLQDLLQLHGNHIWEETFTKVLKQCAQREHVGFVKKKEETVVSFTCLNDLKAQTFFGHLLYQVLQLTCPSRSMFIEPMSGWFDADGHELLGLHFFDVLDSCVGQVGLASLDSLLTVLIKENLEHGSRGLRKLVDARCLEELFKLDDSLGPATSLPLLGGSSYKQMIKIVNASWDPWVETLAFIGQLQLLRCLVCLKLKSTCKIKAGVISFAAESMVTSVYSEREMILKHIETKGDEDAAIGIFLGALEQQQKLCGFLSPMQTIYISESPPTFLGRFASVFSITQLSRYVLDAHLGTLTSRSKKAIIDFSPVVIGLGTFLNQFHPFYMIQYLQYMGQYVRTIAETTFGALYDPQKASSDSDPTSEVHKSAFWLMYFCKYMRVPKDIVDSCLPPSLVSLLQT